MTEPRSCGKVCNGRDCPCAVAAAIPPGHYVTGHKELPNNLGRIVYFDRLPSGAITAEQVRELKKINDTSADCMFCDLRDKVLHGLLTHPGVSSTARAVIEAALE